MCEKLVVQILWSRSWWSLCGAEIVIVIAVVIGVRTNGGD